MSEQKHRQWTPYKLAESKPDVAVPASGPKFDYKLGRFHRLAKHAQALLASDVPVVLCWRLQCYTDRP
jgi:hypothetical protein